MGGGCFLPWPQRPYPDECCGAVGPFDDDDDPAPQAGPATARFPTTAWNPDILALRVLPEFFAQDWRRRITLQPPSSFMKGSVADELTQLASLGRRHRRERVGEIIDQNTKFHDYFAQYLMLTPYSHPQTYVLLKMGARVAEVLMAVYKLEHERPRPQQLRPQLMPLLDLPGHSAYPSGHAMIGRLIALCLADVVPDRRTGLIRLSERVAQNREIAGLHYPSDSEAGYSVAEQAHPVLQACASYGPTLRAAAAEFP
jgi:acid phosphatase (class A)